MLHFKSMLDPGCTVYRPAKPEIEEKDIESKREEGQGRAGQGRAGQGRGRPDVAAYKPPSWQRPGQEPWCAALAPQQCARGCCWAAQQRSGTPSVVHPAPTPGC